MCVCVCVYIYPLIVPRATPFVHQILNLCWEKLMILNANIPGSGNTLRLAIIYIIWWENFRPFSDYNSTYKLLSAYNVHTRI